MCHSVCGAEEPIACGLYPPLVYMCHSVCGVEEPIACGLYPPLVSCAILCVVLKSPLRVDCILHLYVCMCHFQCGGGSMMTITCLILKLSCIQYMLIYLQMHGQLTDKYPYLYQ